jgi:hypothetical protein
MSCSAYPLLPGPFAEHMQLCLRLSWALLHWEATISSCSSSSGIRRSRNNQCGQDCRNAEEHARWSLFCAAVMGIGFSGDVAAEVLSRSRTDIGYPQLADQLADSAVFGLLLLNFALCVGAMHTRVSQESSRQVPLPDQHHRVLLQQLGVEWLELMPFAQHVGEQRARQPVQFILAASETLGQHLNRAALGTSSSSSSRPATALTAAANSSGSSSSSGVATAAMQTLLQAALLPMPGQEVSWFEDMGFILSQLLSRLSGSALAAAAAVMLQPFLTQLMPAGLNTIRSAKLAAPGNSDNATPNSVSNEHDDRGSAAALEPSDMLCVSMAASLHELLSTGGQQQQCRPHVHYLQCTAAHRHALCMHPAGKPMAFVSATNQAFQACTTVLLLIYYGGHYSEWVGCMCSSAYRCCMRPRLLQVLLQHSCRKRSAAIRSRCARAWR